MYYIFASPAAAVPSSSHWGDDSNPVTEGTASTHAAAESRFLRRKPRIPPAKIGSVRRAHRGMQHYGVMNLGIAGEQWFTIIITLGSALVAAGGTLAASLVTQSRTRKAELSRHWADKRVDVHERFMAAIEKVTSEIVPFLGDGQEINHEVLEELYDAGRAVAIFGAKATARAAKRVVDATERTRTMDLPEDQGDRYGVAEMVNDGYEAVVSDYLTAMREEIGTKYR